MRGQLLFVLLVVVLLRLPFLNQAIQGDDVYYLAGAEHAQIDPLHPNHARYPFMGDLVDMRGHPHPPFDAWFLGGLLALLGTVSEPAYHAAYILFSLIAAISALSLARKLSPNPLAAVLLFFATPAFVVNGNSLESDLPFLAFWLASIAVFMTAVEKRSRVWLGLSLIPMALAAMTAYQSILLVPILWLYLWLRRRDWKLAWIAAIVPPLVLAAWQLWERASTGGMPAIVLAGYMQSYGLQVMMQKLKNAAALTAHLGWVVFLPLAIAGFWTRRAWLLLPLVLGAAFVDSNPLFWLSAGCGLLVLLWCAMHIRDFAAAWVLIFFAGALIVFFAGSARYLLPIALPVAILASRNVAPRWLWTGAACGFALSFSLAAVNYRHWDGYRQFANRIAGQATTHRVWINGEWGLRFYLERDGALPLMRNQPVHPGDIVVTSSLAYPIPVTTGGGKLVPLFDAGIASRIPLRLVALNGKSAYSTTMFGLRPFDISAGVIDRVRAETVVERKPTLSYLPMNALEAGEQIVSGVYSLESNSWRWMGGRGILLLKSPPQPAPIEVHLYIPSQSPARGIALSLDGQAIAGATYTAPGVYTLQTPTVMPAGSEATLVISADKTFSVPGDSRQLSLILTAAGFARR